MKGLKIGAFVMGFVGLIIGLLSDGINEAIVLKETEDRVNQILDERLSKEEDDKK